MDRNQIIGWILIVGIVIGFFTFNSSQEPETDENTQKTSQVQTNTRVEEKSNEKPENTTIPSQSGTVIEEDSAVIKYQKEQLKTKYGVFAGSAEKNEEEVVIENNKIRLYINTNGAYVSKAVLKEHRSYSDYAADKENELILFEGEGNHQIIKFNHYNKPQSTKNFKFRSQAIY